MSSLQTKSTKPKNEAVLTWDSALTRLIKGKTSKTIEKLLAAGYTQLKDLLWIKPLKTQVHPPVNTYAYAAEESLFQGIGKVLNIQHKPNFKSKGKSNVVFACLASSVSASLAFCAGIEKL